MTNKHLIINKQKNKTARLQQLDNNVCRILMAYCICHDQNYNGMASSDVYRILRLLITDNGGYGHSYEVSELGFKWVPGWSERQAYFNGEAAEGCSLEERFSTSDLIGIHVDKAAECLWVDVNLSWMPTKAQVSGSCKRLIRDGHAEKVGYKSNKHFYRAIHKGRKVDIGEVDALRGQRKNVVDRARSMGYESLSNHSGCKWFRIEQADLEKLLDIAERFASEAAVVCKTAGERLDILVAMRAEAEADNS